MAPWGTISATPSSAPLADYFFISGIEAHNIFDAREARKRQSTVLSNPLALDITVEEDDQPSVTQRQTLPKRQSALSADDPQDDSTRPTSANGSNASPAAKRASSRFSYDKRKSGGSIIGLETTVNPSNRSSATLRAIRDSTVINGMSEEDFEQALRKFAADRDSILDEIQFSAGQLANPARPAPKSRPKAPRVVSADFKEDRGVAGLRRRLSTMNPLSRSGTTSRRSSVRVSRRLSGYNSVIPTPQRFARDENMHPLKRPYEPTLLDRYPPKDNTDEPRGRCPFPDYVPMFVFPNDINVVSSDERPKTTWHGFAMTNSDGSRLYGISIIVWIPLDIEAADELERQCDIWRKNNMTQEERELAHSLGERLAVERSHLQDLLTRLREGDYDLDDRESFEEQISAVEEKISLMTDMLKPVRHGAASRIEGLTDGDSGLWIPRAYGLLGRDAHMTSFWKEWLRAVATPMMNGGVLRVPPSSPRVGTWQPLERYVINLCMEALSPTNSLTQVELGLRELRVYARKDAINEIPGARNTDLYSLFRSLSIEEIIALYEYVMSESRIILLSSHTSMLHLASAALVQLIYPLKWTGVFIPVLPARLKEALEAPCPYIVGIERRYESVQLPDEDYVLVDLDQGELKATDPAPPLPRQQRNKLRSILYLAAPHQARFGVPKGPPLYATDAFPHSAFSTENPTLFDSRTPHASLADLVSRSSSQFGQSTKPVQPPTFNAFFQGRPGMARRGSSNSTDRPSTGSTNQPITPPSPGSSNSPVTTYFPAIPRNDSGYALQASLREKRSGLFENPLRRNSSFGLDKVSALRRPSVPLSVGMPSKDTSPPGHSSSASISTLGNARVPSQYAPSTYAQSTLAASTMMPQVMMQPVKNTEGTTWHEGHCMQWTPLDKRVFCSICEEGCDDGVHKCRECGTNAHTRCLEQICLVCPAAFHHDQILAAFVRCSASLFYTYRKFMGQVSPEQKRTGQLYRFNMDAFIRSTPHDSREYLNMLRETQAFNQFIQEREHTKLDDPSIVLFDEIIAAKRNRGGRGRFSKSSTTFLSKTEDHLWRTAAATPQLSRSVSNQNTAVGRAPATLDHSLMKEPRVMQGVARPVNNARARGRKPVPSMLSPLRTRAQDWDEAAAQDPSTAFAPNV